MVNGGALAGMLVQPETVLGSHRELARKNWVAFGRSRRPDLTDRRPSLWVDGQFVGVTS
jgi:hypothetical protein